MRTAVAHPIGLVAAVASSWTACGGVESAHKPDGDSVLEGSPTMVHQKLLREKSTARLLYCLCRKCWEDDSSWRYSLAEGCSVLPPCTAACEQSCLSNSRGVCSSTSSIAASMRRSSRVALPSRIWSHGQALFELPLFNFCALVVRTASPLSSRMQRRLRCRPVDHW